MTRSDHDHDEHENHDEADACESCPHDDGGESVSPSIFTAAWRSLPRRRYAQALATVGGLTAVGSLAAPVASLTEVFEQQYTGPIYSEGVHLVDGDGNRVTTETLDYGEGMTVYPATHPGIAKAPTVLVRYEESEYGGETRMDSVVEGYAAYSKVCTHAGCIVGSENENPLVCPCHFGKYDPTQGASVVGGPPPRPLPQLPITQTESGELIAIGDFEAPVGAGGE